ncbi:MAG: DUF5009 domain-containing protein [Prolixibacteraceae bacterium]|nr:DUF5009 domain-containing protein [Prolixibacteraceae bacterium]MBN2774097.1 DUF5009 domain-containing protein [Prolixibacteraceae bacterium]
MAEKTRIVSIDIMRGLTLFLMLFVNDLYVKGVPQWMVHTKANVDGMGLADWVFPGFLFMVGMSIPFAIKARANKGDSKLKISGHILLRTISLLIIGVLMFNSGRLNPELSGINEQLWAILMYVSVFLIWNQYPLNPSYRKIYLGLKIIGILGLVMLAVVFHAGTAENVSWLKTGWWGILGLIGWGYLAAAFAYLLIGNKIPGILFAWLFFVALNILSELGLLNFLNPVQPVLGTLIGGNTPSVVLAGLLFSLVFQSLLKSGYKKLLISIILLGGLSIIIGFILRNWFIISKIKATPSWGMLCNGISILLFAVVFLIADVWKKTGWAKLFNWVGQNSLTTYLAPDIVYYSIWGLGLHVFFYKQDSNMILAVAGSIVWALLMVLFSVLLSRFKIRLKL